MGIINYLILKKVKKTRGGVDVEFKVLPLFFLR